MLAALLVSVALRARLNEDLLALLGVAHFQAESWKCEGFLIRQNGGRKGKAKLHSTAVSRILGNVSRLGPTYKLRIKNYVVVTVN